MVVICNLLFFFRIYNLASKNNLNVSIEDIYIDAAYLLVNIQYK